LRELKKRNICSIKNKVYHGSYNMQAKNTPKSDSNRKLRGYQVLMELPQANWMVLKLRVC